MDFIKINDVSPNSKRLVLLAGRDSNDSKWHYVIGMLGGCDNAPQFQIDGRKLGDKIIISATHWCELTEPK